MSGPAVEVAAVRTAVRRALREIECPAGTPLLVACSGGADSLAMASAVAHLCGATRNGGWPAYGAVVDHGLQDDSAGRAAKTAALLERLGLPTRILPVEVVGPGGMEAAARRARYIALREARPSPDSPVLLGHTLDDQAETVLLGLGRGSGARSLAGMAPYDPPWLRPLLGVRRATTRAACAAQGLAVWDDPHNVDPRFIRVRLRREVLPLLEDVLAGGVAGALARTAAQLTDDVAALDELAVRARVGVEVPPRPSAGAEPAGHREPAGHLEPAGYLEPAGHREPAEHLEPVGRSELVAAALAGHPVAVRRRVLRAWLRDAGARELTDARLRAADDLVGRWRGQGAVALPGGMALSREHGRLVLRAIDSPGTP